MTDLFCGAGGSTSGAIIVPGVRVVMAANHWKLAIDVHNANHPDTDHAPVDLHEENPRYFPRTHLLWASPECTKWSQSNSGPLPAIEEGLFEDPLSDDATRRSRLLMFDVLRFAEFHRYEAIIVENVVDIAMQAKYRLAWRVWRDDLVKLGYKFRVVSLNSMHAQTFGPPAPQSRDRIYIVCWRKGNRAPDIDRILRPKAWCPHCETMIESQQAWKNGRTVGRYRQSYVYVHAACGTVVEPGWLPAATAIDWAIPGTRIGDKTTPLVDKTRRRIAAGIVRYWQHPFVAEVAGNTFERRPGVRTWPVDEPLRTLHTTMSKALLVPVEGRDGKEARPAIEAMRTQTTRAETAIAMPAFLTQFRERIRDLDPAREPLPTVVADGANHGLVQAPFIAELRGGSSDARSTMEPLATVTASGNHHALVMRNNSSKGDGGEMVTPAYETLRTLTTTGHQSVITPGDVAAAEAQVDDCLFRMLQPHEVAAGMAFPAHYDWNVLDSRGRTPSNRNLVRMAGNAVTPPAARDTVHVVAESLN